MNGPGLSNFTPCNAKFSSDNLQQLKIMAFIIHTYEMMILVNDQNSIATVPATDKFEITFLPDLIHGFNKNYILIYHGPPTVPATDKFEITFLPDLIHGFNKNYILIYHGPHLHNTRLLQ